MIRRNNLMTIQTIVFRGSGAGRRQAARAAGIFAIFLGLLFGVAPANADWRAELGTFRVGMVGSNAPQANRKKAEPFRLAMSEALGLDVEIVPFRDFATLIAAQSAGRIEYAMLSTSAFATEWVNCQCVEPVVIATDQDGSSSIRAIAIARSGGPDSLAALKGKSVIAIAGKFVGTYHFARFEMARQGFNLGRMAGRLNVMLASANPVAAFHEGKDDAIIGWSSMEGDRQTGYSRGTLRALAIMNGGSAAGYEVIWQSAAVPLNAHAVRKNLNAEAKMILRKFLLNLYQDDPVAYDSVEPIHGGGYVVAKQYYYQPFINFIQSFDKRQKPGLDDEGAGKQN